MEENIKIWLATSDFYDGCKNLQCTDKDSHFYCREINLG